MKAIKAYGEPLSESCWRGQDFCQTVMLLSSSPEFEAYVGQQRLPSWLSFELQDSSQAQRCENAHLQEYESPSFNVHGTSASRKAMSQEEPMSYLKLGSRPMTMPNHLADLTKPLFIFPHFPRLPIKRDVAYIQIALS